MTKLTLIIGNKNYSSWSLRVWIFLKQFGIEFTEKRIPLFTDTTDTQLEKYNSDFKVPVLIDGDLIIWDSLAILEYLSEQYLASNGLPNDTNQRAIARSVSAEMHSSFFNIRNDLPMNCRKSFNNISLSAQTEKEIQRIKSIWQQCREKHGNSGDYLFGKYSIADAMFAPIVMRFNTYNIKLEGEAKKYSQTILNQQHIIEWVKSSKQEKEIIESGEIKT
ncbi:Glutathione S-transferase [uncultured Candidatus Thioglobus sp.]|nr:Glutathione S-transferase [uncultured Candidatus Thioglobus sp.]